VKLLTLLRGDRVAYSVLRELAKAYQLGLGVSARAISRVYGVRPASVYDYFNKLEEQGIVTRRGREYALTDRRIAEAVHTLLESEARALGYSGGELVLYTKVPDTAYYVSSAPGKVFAPKRSAVVVIDEKVYRRLSGEDVKALEITYDAVVSASLRGRRRIFDWEVGLTKADYPYCYADLLAYHPFPIDAVYSLVYDVEVGVLTLKEVLKLCRNERCARIVEGLASKLGSKDVPQISLTELSEEEKALVDEGLKALTKTPKLHSFQ